MDAIAIVILVVIVGVAVIILGLRRRPRQDEGMHTFRRHIDALSPEARREVMDRARKHDDRQSGSSSGDSGGDSGGD